MVFIISNKKAGIIKISLILIIILLLLFSVYFLYSGSQSIDDLGLLRKASISLDLTICDKISDFRIQYSCTILEEDPCVAARLLDGDEGEIKCYLDVAEENLNLQACNRIGNIVGNELLADGCEAQVQSKILLTGNPSFCMGDPDCLTSFAISNNDLKYCNLINGSEGRIICLSLFNEWLTSECSSLNNLDSLDDESISYLNSRCNLLKIVETGNIGACNSLCLEGESCDFVNNLCIAISSSKSKEINTCNQLSGLFNAICLQDQSLCTGTQTEELFCNAFILHDISFCDRGKGKDVEDCKEKYAYASAISK